MDIKEKIQKEIERDKKEIRRVVNDFIYANQEITRLRYAIDYLVGEEMDLNKNIEKNEEKLKSLNF